MSRHDDAIRLRHMLDHAREVVALSAGKSRQDLNSERMLDLALARLLEIVGEAASQVSDEVQRRHPEIPWPQIVSLRNRLTEGGYDAIDYDILWQIITIDAPALIAALEKIIPPGE